MGPFSHCGPTVVVSGTSSLESRPAWEHARRPRGAVFFVTPVFDENVLYNEVGVLVF